MRDNSEVPRIRITLQVAFEALQEVQRPRVLASLGGVEGDEPFERRVVRPHLPVEARLVLFGLHQDRRVVELQVTAEYGDFTRGPRVVNQQTKDEMRKILKEIQDGTFAREFIGELNSGGKKFEAMRVAEKGHPIEAVGKELRNMMSWIRDARKDSSDPNAR